VLAKHFHRSPKLKIERTAEKSSPEVIPDHVSRAVVKKDFLNICGGVWMYHT